MVLILGRLKLILKNNLNLFINFFKATETQAAHSSTQELEFKVVSSHSEQASAEMGQDHQEMSELKPHKSATGLEQ